MSAGPTLPLDEALATLEAIPIEAADPETRRRAEERVSAAVAEVVAGLTQHAPTASALHDDAMARVRAGEWRHGGERGAYSAIRATTVHARNMRNIGLSDAAFAAAFAGVGNPQVDPADAARIDDDFTQALTALARIAVRRRQLPDQLLDTLVSNAYLALAQRNANAPAWFDTSRPGAARIAKAYMDRVLHNEANDLFKKAPPSAPEPAEPADDIDDIDDVAGPAGPDLDAAIDSVAALHELLTDPDHVQGLVASLPEGIGVATHETLLDLVRTRADQLGSALALVGWTLAPTSRDALNAAERREDPALTELTARYRVNQRINRARKYLTRYLRKWEARRLLALRPSDTAGRAAVAAAAARYRAAIHLLRERRPRRKGAK